MFRLIPMATTYVIDSASDRPKFRQLADQIRGHIHAGRYRPGDQLPAEGELAALCGVAVGTVNQALRLLQSDGLIAGERGRRWQVLPVRTSQADLYAIGQRNYGPDPTTAFAYMHGVPWESFDTEREYQTVPAPDRVAANLDIAPGTDVCQRQWTHSIDGKIIRVGWSYVDLARFADTVLVDADAPAWPGGTIAQLKSLGYDVRYVFEQVGLTTIDRGQAGLLGLPARTRVLSRWRTQHCGGIGSQTSLAVETAFHLFARSDVELEYEVRVHGRL